MEQRQCYTFFLSFYDAIVDLKDKDQLQVYRAITEYGLFGVVPEINGVAMSIFKAVKPNIDSSNKRRESGRKGGLAGGAPVGNQNAAKNKANSNQNKANSNQNQTNIKENVKENMKYKDEVEYDYKEEKGNEYENELDCKDGDEFRNRTVREPGGNQMEPNYQQSTISNQPSAINSQSSTVICQGANSQHSDYNGQRSIGRGQQPTQVKIDNDVLREVLEANRYKANYNK